MASHTSYLAIGIVRNTRIEKHPKMFQLVGTTNDVPISWESARVYLLARSCNITQYQGHHLFSGRKYQFCYIIYRISEILLGIFLIEAFVSWLSSDVDHNTSNRQAIFWGTIYKKQYDQINFIKYKFW